MSFIHDKAAGEPFLLGSVATPLFPFPYRPPTHPVRPLRARPMIQFLPTSVLAATIFAVIYKFFNFLEPVRLYRVGVADMMMWLATFAATLGLSVKEGIVVGMAVSAFTLIQRWERDAGVSGRPRPGLGVGGGGLMVKCVKVVRV